MQQTFTSIYERNIWGNNRNKHYSGSSGPGSALEFNRPYINFLREFIRDKDVSSVADIGCGDFRCGPLIYDRPIQYVGYDVYEKLINHLNTVYTNLQFKYVDVTKNPELIKPADLCVIKDVMQHWPDVFIEKFLDYAIQHKLFKYIIITNDTAGIDGKDIMLGGYHRVGCNHTALKKYNAVVIFEYPHRQCCLITI